jgi:hypothetical protein
VDNGTRVVALYDKDFLKKFRVYFTTPGESVKFEHGMRNFQGRLRIKPDFIQVTTAAPEDYDGTGVLVPIMLDGAGSARAGRGNRGYDETHVWLRNTSSDWPKAEPIIAEVLCRWYHSHDRIGWGIDNDDESHVRPVVKE